MSRRVVVPGLLLTAVALLAPVQTAAAQDFRRRRERPQLEEGAGVFPYDGRLTFARVKFDLINPWADWARGMPPWGHDYPYSERNFMTILREITAARPYTEGSRIVELRDPELLKYPIAYFSEPGHWELSQADVEALRRYLLKGGFAIFDDFSGRYDWQVFAEGMNRALPGVRFFPMELSHPMYHAFFEIETLELEHPNYRGVMAQFLGIYEDNDPGKRLMAIVNYDTDIGDYFEYSATGFAVVDLTNEAYKLGVNYWVYALTH